MATESETETGRPMTTNCAECGATLTPDATVRYTDEFAVCRSCETDATETWEFTKTSLVADGVQIPCEFVINQLPSILAADPAGQVEKLMHTILTNDNPVCFGRDLCITTDPCPNPIVTAFVVTMPDLILRGGHERTLSIFLCQSCADYLKQFKSLTPVDF